jgi:hypothetical protein
MPQAGADDPHAWLTRLSAEDWMRAGVAELDHAYAALAARQHAPGLAHARRAAGMGVNAVLRAAPAPDARFGRSYMEHLVALVADETVPPAVRAAAQRLVDAPARLELVPLGLGRGPVDLADAARDVLSWAADRL